MTNETRKKITKAMFDTSFPINPIPFANGISEIVMNEGSDTIETDEVKKILWVLMAQAYGQMATIDLCEEWSRLYQTEEK